MRVKIMGCSPLLGDHLGSTSMTVNSDGTLLSEVRYSAFGEERYSSGTMTTDYLYTGQREEAEVGLYYYVARWYDPAIGRFIQADSIVPNPGSAVGSIGTATRLIICLSTMIRVDTFHCVLMESSALLYQAILVKNNGN